MKEAETGKKADSVEIKDTTRSSVQNVVTVIEETNATIKKTVAASTKAINDAADAAAKKLKVVAQGEKKAVDNTSEGKPKDTGKSDEKKNVVKEAKTANEKAPDAKG